jgi:hypothetical protein
MLAAKVGAKQARVFLTHTMPQHPSTAQLSACLLSEGAAVAPHLLYPVGHHLHRG